MDKVRETLSHNYEGSAFVWRQLTKNPVLCVFGLPLLALDTMLLPFRHMFCRDKPPSHKHDHQFRHVPSLSYEQMSDYYRSNPGDLPCVDAFGRAYDPQHSWRPIPLSDWGMEEDPEDGESKRKKKHGSKKAKKESVIYPGWSLPDRGTDPTARHRYRSRSSGALTPSRRKSYSRSDSPATAWRKYQNQFAGEQPQHGIAGNQGYMPPPVNDEDLAAESARSSSRRPRRSTRQSFNPPQSQHNLRLTEPAPFDNQAIEEEEEAEDQESLITGGIFSHGTNASARSLEYSDGRPPSTILTHPRFRPTGRADSIAPGESASLHGMPTQPYHGPENSGRLGVSRGSKRPSRTGEGCFPVPEVFETEHGKYGGVQSRMPRLPNPTGQRYPRSPTISTIDANELPSTVSNHCECRSTGGQARSRRPPTTSAQGPAEDRRSHGCGSRTGMQKEEVPVVESPFRYCTSRTASSIDSDELLDASPLYPVQESLGSRSRSSRTTASASHRSERLEVEPENGYDGYVGSSRLPNRYPDGAVPPDGGFPRSPDAQRAGSSFYDTAYSPSPDGRSRYSQSTGLSGSCRRTPRRESKYGQQG